MSATNPIGFMDSGVGGISVLREAVKLLPNENFIYYGDSANAPYGTRPKEEILALTQNVVEFLLKNNAKAVVIACNTATSFAIKELRESYSIPIIGIEPALKPAAKLYQNSKIIVMATVMTLKGEKFAKLAAEYAGSNKIIPIACPGLVELIEEGDFLQNDKVDVYLKNILKDYINEDISAIVLGCTHYPFIKPHLQKLFSDKTMIIDGSYGTCIHLANQLEKFTLLNTNKDKGSVQIYNSSNSKKLLDLCQLLLSLK